MLFFVPEAKAVTDAILTDHNLHDLIGQQRTHRQTSRGPSGGSGLLIASSSLAGDRLHCEMDSQRWSPRYGMSSQVGTWNDCPTDPTTLARGQAIPGPVLTLGDGQAWQIPLLREFRSEDIDFRGKVKLPRVMEQCPDTGRFVFGAVVDQYAELWRKASTISEQIFAQLTGGKNAEIDDQLAEELLVDLLRVNYRVDASVISHLKLLTKEHFAAVIRAALDIETLEATIKKLHCRPS